MTNGGRSLTAYFRPATEEDLPLLTRIEIEASALFSEAVLPPHLRTPLPREELRACLAAALLWVAEQPGCGVVAFIAARSHGDVLHLLEMDVLPAHGGRGIGTSLLRHLCSIASERGFRAVTLTTFARIPWNAPFYAANGFEELVEPNGYLHLDGVLRSERANGLENRIAMVRNVS